MEAAERAYAGFGTHFWRRVPRSRTRGMGKAARRFAKSRRTSDCEIVRRNPITCETNSEKTFQSTPSSGSMQYKVAQIHDPTKNQMNSVNVIEDTACGKNFISPGVAKRCNLTVFSATPIINQTLMGNFTSNQWTEVTWVGSSGNNGRDWFYVAPEQAPIEVLVGIEFMKDHPDAFKDMAQLEPAFLNVQSQVKVSHQ